MKDSTKAKLTDEQINKTKELFDLGDYLMFEYLVTLELPIETMNQVKKVMGLNNEVFGDGEINFTFEKENEYFEEFDILMTMLGLEKTCNGLIEIQMKQSKFELWIFDNIFNVTKGQCFLDEGHNTYDDVLKRIDSVPIDDTKEHYTIVEYGEDLTTVVKETWLNSKKEIINVAKLG